MKAIDLENMAAKEGTEFRYLVLASRGGDIFPFWFRTSEEANNEAENQWESLTYSGKKKETIQVYFVMASDCGTDDDSCTDWDAYETLWPADDLFDSSRA